MKPLDKKYRDLTMLCLAGLMLALAGCGESGGPSGPPGAHPMMGPPGAPRPGSGPMASGGPPGIGPNSSANSAGIAPPGLNPPHVTPAPDKEKGEAGSEGDKKNDNPLASVIKIEEAGNLVNLASEIIAAGVNPFFSRLPRPLQTEPTTGADAGTTPATDVQAPPPPPVNPLDGINLLGIVYNPKSPIALISVPNAKYASQVVRTGELLTLDQGQAIIGKITQQSVDIRMLGQKTDKRTIVIADIIGYASTQGSSESGAASSSSDGASGSFGGSAGGALGSMFGASSSGAPKPAAKSSSQSGAPAGGPGLGASDPKAGMGGSSPMGMGGMGSAGLSNLKRLANGVTGPSAASPGANVSLKEP